MGCRRVRKGASGDQGTCRKDRARMVEEPRGFAQEGPGGRRAARAWNEEPRPAGKDGGMWARIRVTGREVPRE